MSTRFYVGYVAVVLCLVWGVELVLGSLYARYIIIYTGGVFLAGLIIGQRYEQAWLSRQSDSPRPSEGDRHYRPSTQPVTTGSSGKGAGS